MSTFIKCPECGKVFEAGTGYNELALMQKEFCCKECFMSMKEKNPDGLNVIPQSKSVFLISWLLVGIYFLVRSIQGALTLKEILLGCLGLFIARLICFRKKEDKVQSSDSLSTNVEDSTYASRYDVELAENQKIELVRLTAGAFIMGSPSSEIGRDNDERLHRVNLTYNYYISRTPVTCGQWKVLMGSYPYPDDMILSGEPDDEMIPMHCVTWTKAMEFCQKLTEYERKQGHLPQNYEYSLPTEAEWEYACRGMGNSQGCHGDYDMFPLDEIAWYENNSFNVIHPVGQKQPSEVLGLLDMLGNVSEWCADWYGYYSGDAIDPRGPEEGEYRVERGGSWCRDISHCRAAFRDRDLPYRCFTNVGFRVVLVPLR